MPFSLSFQLLHIFSVYLHRVLLFFPAMASFYVAIFNSWRLHSGLVTVHDFFTYFEPSNWLRLLPLGTMLFFMGFATSLQWTLLPLFFYIHIVTVFALPLRVDHPHLSASQCIFNSVHIANGHFGPLALLVILCWVLNFLGLVCFVVGIYFTLPFGHITMCYAYHHIIGVKGAQSSMDPMQIK